MSVNIPKLLADLKHPPTFFSRLDFALALFLGLLPSVWDMGTDYYFAEYITESNTGEIPIATVKGLTYAFISLPGLMLAFSFLQQHLFEFLASMDCCSEPCHRLVLHCITLMVIGAILAGVSLLVLFSSSSFFYLAIPSSFFIVGVKALGLILHSPEMKKLSVRISAVEAQWEASLQLFLVSFMLFKGGELNLASIASILSSITMIGKAGAQNFLTFGQENKFDNTSLMKKLKLLAQFSPVFIITATFRIGSLAIIVAWGIYYAAIVHWPSALFIPFLVILIARSFAMKDLTLGHLLQGVVAELTTISIWGKRGREGSRNVQLFMATYLLILNSVFLVWVLLDHTADTFVHSLGGPFNPAGTSKPVLSPGLNKSLLPLVILCFICGLLSYPLHLLQLFYMIEPWSIILKHKTGSSGI